ncbi:MAG TPA: hypothetical protein VLN49_08375 [Gemmatimonadaceae bacterium]|nr:hypothetical protein [Gemmatimonadaceae bacterium]
MTRLALAGALLLAGPAALGAQVRDRAVSDSAFAIWASASLGPGGASGSRSTLVGGQFAVWGSVNEIVFGVRRAGAANLDNRDTYDTAALVGLRARSTSVTAFAAVGPSVIGGTRSGDALGSEVGLSAAGEYALNFRYIGAGVAAFGAIGSRTRFAGVGFTLELGKIR